MNDKKNIWVSTFLAMVGWYTVCAAAVCAIIAVIDKIDDKVSKKYLKIK